MLQYDLNLSKVIKSNMMSIYNLREETRDDVCVTCKWHFVFVL